MSNLAKLFPTWKTTGALFTEMDDTPWENYIDAQTLDIMYFGFHSGIKQPTQFVLQFTEDGVADGEFIAPLLLGMYKQNWERLWESFVAEYDPIEAFKIVENGTDTVSGSSAQTNNLQRTNTGTQGNSGSSSNSESNDVAGSRSGFNSSEQVPVNSSSQRVTGSTQNTNTRTDNLTETNTGTIGTTGSSTETIAKTRKGNIGYRTYQQLIKEEIEVWKWQYFETVFSDIDKVLALSVYDPCQKL